MAFAADPPPSSLLYVSNGNIPSRWAHTVQSMKMCESLAELVPGFRLLIAGSLAERVTPSFDLWRWYGVTRPFEVERLPLWLWRREPLFASAFERRFSWAAPRRAARLRPALVWTRSLAIADRCLRRGLPVLFERHSPPPPEYLPVLARIGADPLLRGVVTNSEHLLAAHRDAGIPDAKLAALRNGADARLLEATRADSLGARAALDLPKEGPLALYAGSLSPAKGLETLLAAAALRPATHFAVLGGSDTDVSTWRTRAPANVRFAGFVPHGELATWLEAADVGVFPNSAADSLAASTSPLKVVEYAAAGLPIAACEIPALRGWLRDGDDAFLCRPDDPADLARAIDRAVSSPELATACAARLRGRIAGFTWRARAEQLLERFAPELLS